MEFYPNVLYKATQRQHPLAINRGQKQLVCRNLKHVNTIYNDDVKEEIFETLDGEIISIDADFINTGQADNGFDVYIDL